MNLNFHPDAIRNFDGKANGLLAGLREISPRRINNRLFESEQHVTEIPIEDVTVTDEGIEPVLDGEGNRAATILFRHERKHIGLLKDESASYERLVDGLLKNRSLSGIVSGQFLSKVLRDWLRENYLKRTDVAFCEYLESECNTAVVELEMWVPIAQALTQVTFDIGPVTFKPIPKALFDRMAREFDEYEHKAALFQIESVRRDLQGLAAATMHIKAEPQKAEEILLQEADRAISFLRVFSPANVRPQLTSFCTMLGRENIQSYQMLTFRGSDSISHFRSEMPNQHQEVQFDEAQIAWMKQRGLDALNSVLGLEKLTEFQTAVLDALILYSKSCLKADLTDRLIYILVPLESILLKSGNEPILQNVGERLAMAMGDSIEARRAIFDNVKATYDIRSKFIHHAQVVSSADPTDMANLQRFMETAFQFFLLLMRNLHQFEKKIDFINELDTMKFSGGI